MSGVIIQILALVLVTRIADSSDLDDHGLGRNFSHVLKGLMTNYDPRLRPNFGRGPLYVGMDLAIASFDAISEVNMDFTLTLNLNQYWKDERLSFSSKHEVFTLSGDFSEKIWVPDTFFPNDKHSYLHDVTEKNKMVKLHGDGSIAYGMRFTTTLSCMMDLHYYPLDYQNCTIEIESYGYAEEDVAMYWKETPATGVEKLELQQFTIMEYRAIDKKIKLATGTYQRLSLSFKLSRSIGYFIIQTYLPVILIVMLSWVSFWINHEATPARVALGITTVLTMTTISTGVRSSLPRISYIKAIDIYLVMGFVFVFAALLEYAAVNYTNACRNAKKQKAAIAEKAAAEKAKEKPAEKPIDDNKPPISISLPAVFTPDGKDDLFPVEDFPPMCDHGFEGHDAFSHYHHQPSHHDVRRRNFGSPSEPSLVQSAVSAIKAKAPEVRKFFELKDVSDIDRYARMVFPASFLVFNAFYWVFYTMKANATEP